MSVDIDLLRKVAKVTVMVMPEWTPWVGNCSGIDPETDARAEEWIREQLGSGNEWAWCAVTVTASYAGISESDHLGCCSYESEAQFRQAGDYYEDMERVALSRLAETLNGMGVKIASVSS